jgi:hypothetical protein
MKKIFYLWALYSDENGIMRTVLEISFKQKSGEPIMWTFKDPDLRIRSDNWIKKYIKNRVPELKNFRIKLISTQIHQSNYYKPTILFALSED